MRLSRGRWVDRDRTGAHWALSPFSILASAPLWISGLVVNEPAAFLGATALAQVFAFSALGYLAMGSLLLVADRLPVVRRRQGASAFAVIVALVIVASEARLLVVLAGFEITGLPDEVSLPVRAISSPVLALAAFGFAGAALDARARHRDERDRLLLSVLRATQRVEGHEVTVSAMSSVLRESVRGRLAEARPEIARELDALKTALDDGRDGRRELERLNSITDARWREISAEAWKRFIPDQSRAGLREFAWAFALTRPFTLPGTLLGAGALTFFVFARAQPPLQAALSLLTWLVLVSIVSVVAAAAVRSLPVIALPIVLAAVAVLLTFPVWLLLAGIVEADQTELLVRIAVISLHVVAVMLLAGASPAIARNRDAVLVSLRRHRDTASVQQLQIESRLLGVAHELAATLHGSSRSAFMADALRLEAALDRGDRVAAIALVEQVRDTILDAERSVDEPRGLISADDIDAVIDNWRSVCGIDVRGSWHEVPTDLLDAAHTVVIEGISDAMRHGDCGHIEIEVNRDARGVRISMANDGALIGARVGAGLGTALLDHLAPGAWRRDVDGHGRTRLAVTLVSPDDRGEG